MQSDVSQLKFYSPVHGETIEEQYVAQFIHGSKHDRQRQDISKLLSAIYRVTIMSNLIDVANRLDLNTVTIMPRVGFEKQVDRSHKFSQSNIISTYHPDLPNRPYTFE